MQIIALDFETYFDSEYTLKKMTTEAYIRDPRFEVHGCAVWEGFASTNNLGFPTWMGPDPQFENFSKLAKTIDWSTTAILAHHAHFEGLILSHHYGIKPAFWFDTLCMARMLYGTNNSLSLAALAKRFGLPEKNVPYDLFRGRHWHEIDEDTQFLIGEGCINDVALTAQIFSRLLQNFPLEELDIIDQTIRMFTESKLIGDTELLNQIKQDEWDRKNEMLLELGVTGAQLRSTAHFKRLLEAEGVDVEMKEGKNAPIPAVAKTDQFIHDLEDHPNERVRQLAAARLDMGSSIAETRAGRLAEMSSRGPMPVYLNYCGASTLRWSGGDKVNFQNFPRGSALRRALHAPEGYDLSVVDLSQIECRMLNTLAGQWDVVENFRLGKDPYVGVASAFYGFEVTKAHPKERGTGKQLELSCGYGSGPATVVATAARGIYGPPVELSLEEAKRAVQVYRESHARVVAYWHEANRMLNYLGNPHYDAIEWGPLKVQPGRIVVPNGASMQYELRYNTEIRSWQRRRKSGWQKIWGGVVVQNICEALSRLVVSQAMLRIKAHGYHVALCTHDELVTLIPRGDAAAHDLIIDEMIKPVSWLPELPLAAEGSFGECYAK